MQCQTEKAGRHFVEFLQINFIFSSNTLAQQIMKRLQVLFSFIAVESFLKWLQGQFPQAFLTFFADSQFSLKSKGTDIGLQ